MRYGIFSVDIYFVRIPILQTVARIMPQAKITSVDNIENPKPKEYSLPEKNKDTILPTIMTKDIIRELRFFISQQVPPFEYQNRTINKCHCKQNADDTVYHICAPIEFEIIQPFIYIVEITDHNVFCHTDGV